MVCIPVFKLQILALPPTSTLHDAISIQGFMMDLNSTILPHHVWLHNYCWGDSCMNWQLSQSIQVAAILGARSSCAGPQPITPSKMILFTWSGWQWPHILIFCRYGSPVQEKEEGWSTMIFLGPSENCPCWPVASRVSALDTSGSSSVEQDSLIDWGWV